LVLAALAVTGHVAFWYLPRERAAELDPRSPAGRLLAGGPQSVRAWLAFPHQNVGAAARALADPAAAIGAGARLAGLGEIELPAFGPFALPPADALAIAVDAEGEHLAVVVEVYPAIAIVARVAGTIAGNPILRGGAAVVAGRRVRVAWSGRTWSLRGENAPERAAPPGTNAGDAEATGQAIERRPRAETTDRATLFAQPGLAFLDLGSSQGVVGPGIYRLRREGSDLVLGSAASGRLGPAAAALEIHAREHRLAFLGLRGDGSAPSSLLVMPQPAGRGLELPDAAVAWTPGGEDRRFRLPGERVIELLGIDPLEAQIDGWSVRAIERRSLDAAAAVAPALGPTAREAGAEFLLWVRPGDYLPLVAAIARVLEAIPIAPRDEVERWGDLRTLLEAAGPVEGVRIAVGGDGGEARLGWGGRAR